MSTSEKLPVLAVNHDGFVFDPTTGDSYVLNPTGLAILQGLQDGVDEGQLARDLSEQFVVSEESALQDVSDFVTRLRSMQLM
jgi:PqqD family protein of HPr-rel-A system